MKTKLFISAALLLSTMGLVWAYSNSFKEKELSSLTLANIEALALVENGEGYTSIEHTSTWEVDHTQFIRIYTCVSRDCLEGGSEESCEPGMWTHYYDKTKY